MSPAPRKKVVAPRTHAKGEHRISRAEAEAMFIYYQKVRGSGGMLEVSRKFNRARSSLIKLARREHWEERAEAILQSVRQKVDRKIAKVELSNLELVREIKRAAVKKVLASLKAKTLDVGVREVLAAITTEEELLEKLPEGNKPTEYNAAEIEAALEYVKGLDPAFIAKLGDMMASGAISLDQIVDEFPKGKA